eukprot:TRINITY_DN1178_c0_g1_i1.p1 TRINITY_DN1178_c0_g1~~TRINITY_DN1178_c0_g1_i1.p1  ORF type:complete len:743 (+),score=222.19 TRINITY_DN1178_c0_g1_i1:288-2516(+)
MSWYHPTVPGEIIKGYRRHLDSLIASAASSAPPSLTQFFTTGCFLDQFKSFLEFESNLATLSALLSRGDKFDAAAFRSFLMLLNDSSEKLTAAKISFFVTEFLGTQWGREAYSAVTSQQDLHSLYLVTKCVSDTLDTPIDVFPFLPTFLATTKALFRGVAEIENFVSSVFALSYHLIIRTVLSDETRAFVYSPLTRDVSGHITQCVDRIVKFLKATPKFFPEIMTKGLGSRSATTSALFLFVFVQLLNLDDTNLREYLRSESANLLSAVRNIGHSKLQHVHYAVTRIFAILSGKDWLDFLLSNYLFGNELEETLFFQDVVNDPRLLPYNHPPSIISRVVCETIGNVLDELRVCGVRHAWEQSQIIPDKESSKSGPAPPPEPLSLPEELQRVVWMIVLHFHTLTKRLISHSTGTHRFANIHTARQIAFIQKKMAAAAYSAKLVTSFDVDTFKSSKVEERKSKGKNQTLGVQFQDVQNMFSVIAANDDVIVKADVLASLRHLIKNRSVFNFLKGEANFFQRLLGFCRDGKSVALNKQAFCLFFQMLRYHPGAVETLEKSNQLGHFVEVVGPSSGGTVMLHGLHYIAKLFDLPAIEARSREACKEPLRMDDPKSLDRDYKAFLEFYSKKHLFIKIHMIYKNLEGKETGALTQKLANVYRVLITSPNCSKLYKEIRKNSEFQTEIQFYLAIFNERTEGAETSSTATAAAAASAAAAAASASAAHAVAQGKVALAKTLSRFSTSFKK